MSGNGSADQQCNNYNKDEAVKLPMLMPCLDTVCVPKVEPCYNRTSDSNEDESNIDKLITSSIHFTTPYKVKDPIILLEKCDKIWETLKLIKTVQNDKSSNTLKSLSVENTNAKSYIKYQPVLSNNNAALPNFKLSVKSTRKLYPCVTCGKIYFERRRLGHHSEKIHGILIATLRSKKSITHKNSIDTEKESSTSKTEQNSLKKFNVKKNQCKQVKDSSSHSVTSRVTESNSGNTSNFQSQARKKDNVINTKDSLTDKGNVRKDQKKGVSHKELTQNRTSVSLHDESSSQQQCILCKKFVKDVRKHLVDYHKIDCSGPMLKELEKSSAMLTDNKVKRDNVNNKYLESSLNTNDKQQFQKNGKRKLNLSETVHKKRYKINGNNYQETKFLQSSKFLCEICLELCRPNSFRKHVTAHHMRGETKENFQLMNCNYFNSSLSSKQNINEKQKCSSLENTNACKDRNVNGSINLLKDKKINEQKFKNRREFYMRSKSKHDTTCFCGRQFRDPYTLYLHKSKCYLVTGETEQHTTKNKRETVPNVTGSDTDRDSRFGISIKIKRRNDSSYEIVRRESDNGKSLQDSTCSRDTELASNSIENIAVTDQQEQQYEITESSKYSENHSFLKIQHVDEDMDIDIEGDSQNGSIISNITNKHPTSEIINDSHEKQQENETKTKDTRSSQIISDVKNSLKKVLQTQKCEKYDNVESDTSVKHNLCICGTLFDTKKALDFHIMKHQLRSQLVCGYCNEKFSDITKWKAHQCTVTKFKIFHDVPVELDCHYCNATLNSYTKFDAHMKLQHFDPVLPFECFHCEKRFSSSTIRRNHIKAEHEKIVCFICKMEYLHNMKTRHEGYHYGLGYPCHMCKKTYSSSYILSKHIKNIHPKQFKMM
ncbi:uncharacterized protein LOC116427828 isoform X2 [Nomia melanderi]|nr:zinc finger protein 107-like isoform X2 [Nomia melanderi]XP_031834476.1 zinc finger protein 107-like isoform X2 [Nomia melanderi]XP_031834477.1 zinc finger protein 107-like isoform X2 [Nomia melanderi]XP_031834478.1 zinc finger protein 107-like isoform X2 [Nomia melanderi]